MSHLLKDAKNHSTACLRSRNTAMMATNTPSNPKLLLRRVRKANARAIDIPPMNDVEQHRQAGIHTVLFRLPSRRRLPTAGQMPRRRVAADQRSRKRDADERIRHTDPCRP